MADLAKQLRQINDAQRLRELAQQYGYGQPSSQEMNSFGQSLPQMAGQAMGQRQPGALPPVQMPSFPSIPQGMTPDDANAMMSTIRQAAPQARQMSPYMQNLI
jgi:hypothetical protein